MACVPGMPERCGPGKSPEPPAGKAPLRLTEPTKTCKTRRYSP